MGVFECEQFGRYTRYTYNGCDDCIVMTVKGRTIVINGQDKARTMDLYENINARIEAINEST